MNYKDYQSFKVKHGVIDVFVVEYDGEKRVQIFITDYLSHSTSSVSFNPNDFGNFINFLDNLNDR